MNSDQTKIQELIATLEEEGYTVDEIAKVISNIFEKVYKAFLSLAINDLTDEDLEAINKSEDDEDAIFELSERFHQRTGKDGEQIIIDMIDAEILNFLAQHKLEKINS